jgi:hypothetical protein
MERSRHPPENGSSRTQEKFKRDEPSTSVVHKTLELVDKKKLPSALDRSSSRNTPSLSQSRASQGASSSLSTKHVSSSNRQSTSDRGSSSQKPSPSHSRDAKRVLQSSTAKDPGPSRHQNVAHSQISTAEPSSHDAASRSRAHKSMYITAFDQKMASRQPQIDSLPPEERKKQESWARAQLKLSGTCISGFTWRRVKGGYICNGTNHMVTDELLAEGKGGYHTRNRCMTTGRSGRDWIGPTYPGDMWCPPQTMQRTPLNQISGPTVGRTGGAFARSGAATRSFASSSVRSPSLHIPCEAVTCRCHRDLPSAPPLLYETLTISPPPPLARQTPQQALKLSSNPPTTKKWPPTNGNESLSSTERVQQDNWAQAQLKSIDACAAGYDWRRVPGGYRCNGRRHMVTDELLAEGKGGCYSMNPKFGTAENPIWEGPLYGKEILEHMWGPGGKRPSNWVWR